MTSAIWKSGSRVRSDGTRPKSLDCQGRCSHEKSKFWIGFSNGSECER